MTRTGFLSGLSARLLVLTIGFVMLAEILIYVPSIARYRLSYLESRLVDAHIAALALEATPARELGPRLERRLLRFARAYAIDLKTGDAYTHMLGGAMPPVTDARFDIDRANILTYIREAFVALAQRQNRIIRVAGRSPLDPAVEVEIVQDEAPMRAEMIDYSTRILQLSVVISLFTAALVYISLRWLILRPIARITEAMIDFRDNPEDQSRGIRPTDRRDEIGVAERELAQMQSGLRAALHHRARLAALGEAVTKINHDLRNVLASAQLVSDRLAASADPEVKRVAPTLLRTIDRAVALCSRVLDFARAGVPTLRRETLPLGELVGDAGAAVAAARPLEWKNAVPAGMTVTGDRDQLFRVLVNLGRNAAEAGADRIEISGMRREHWLSILVRDDGPGLPPAARERLFQPFAGSTKSGGSGLGLAIARELMHAHGGEIHLVDTGPHGTTFRLDLPQRRPR